MKQPRYLAFRSTLKAVAYGNLSTTEARNPKGRERFVPVNYYHFHDKKNRLVASIVVSFPEAPEDLAIFTYVFADPKQATRAGARKALAEVASSAKHMRIAYMSPEDLRQAIDDRTLFEEISVPLASIRKRLKQSNLRPAKPRVPKKAVEEGHPLEASVPVEGNGFIDNDLPF